MKFGGFFYFIFFRRLLISLKMSENGATHCYDLIKLSNCVLLCILSNSLEIRILIIMLLICMNFI